MIPSNSEINEKLFHLRRLHPNRVVEVCSNKTSLLKKKNPEWNCDEPYFQGLIHLEKQLLTN